MVISTLRKNSGDGATVSSPIIYDEKKVNISNLSDLIPEDPEKLNDTDEDIYTRMMRPGELNEVIEEADEDVSDDPVSSHGYDQIPGKIHFRGESATIKGKPTIN